MRWGILLILLLACTQAPESILAPPTTISFETCESVKSVGEGCTQTCECLRPTECVKGICSLTKLEREQPCAENAQCQSGYCTENKICGGPDGATASYSCKKECKDLDYDGTEECNTVCRYR